MAHGESVEYSLPLHNPFWENIMPFFLEYEKNGFYYNDICGTATIICDGIALTARHVVEDYIKRLKSKGLEPHEASMYLFGGSKAELSYVGVSNERQRVYRKDIRFFAVQHVEILQNADVAVLKLFEFDKNTGGKIVFPSEIWSTQDNPVIGERLYCYGYPETKSIEIEDERDGLGNEIYLSPTLGTGKVVEVAEYRFVPKLTSPYYRGSFYSVGGMSGAPIFDSQWCMTGVLSTSMDLGDGEYDSYFFTLECLKESKFLSFDKD